MANIDNSAKSLLTPVSAPEQLLELSKRVGRITRMEKMILELQESIEDELAEVRSKLLSVDLPTPDSSWSEEELDNLGKEFDLVEKCFESLDSADDACDSIRKRELSEEIEAALS